MPSAKQEVPQPIPPTLTPQRLSTLPLSEAIRSFTATDNFTRATKRIGNETYKGVTCPTLAEGEWFVVFPKQKEPPTHEEKPAYHLNGASEQLSLRQDFPTVIPDSEFQHARALLFLAANWSRIYRRVVSPEGEAHNLPYFVEVDVNDFTIPRQSVVKPYSPCGKADFIGIGAKGEITIFELSKNKHRKSKQLKRITLGTQKLLATVNTDQTPPDITSYLGVFRMPPHENVLRLMNPSGKSAHERISIDQIHMQDPKAAIQALV